uniref:Lipoprotein n=1 Tax=Candidatus Kentrum sp. FW TaxID=2126338 RepID=A0A450TU77_9GAMM|nr:MAG: hypothetical protein BECKFW1821C_GA0114237_10338 [Candidatus Kentron sp. FW]
MKKYLSIPLAAIGVLLLVGCGAIERKVLPQNSFANADSMERKDYVVLDRVEGTSAKTSILFGAIQIIEGDKLKILGISFFDDKYSYVSPPSGISGIFGGSTTEDRAYFKALSKIPDADEVISILYTKEKTGIPILFRKEKVRFTGKAVKIKTDEEIKSSTETKSRF